jgi:hypothetical protein
MALNITTSIKINATPEQVWAKFTEFDTYADWNPFLTEVSGDIEVGNTISINAGGMGFKPKVLVFDKNKEFKWIGKLFFSGLFDGTHHFLLEDNQDGTTTFHHNEYFKGILVPVFKKQLLNDTKKGFEAMNKKLKERVEKG